MTDNLAWTIVFTVGSFIVGATLGMLGVIIFKAGNINGEQNYNYHKGWKQAGNLDWLGGKRLNCALQ